MTTLAPTVPSSAGRTPGSRFRISRGRRTLVTGLTAFITFLFLFPMLQLAMTSIKDPDQVAAVGAPLWPARPKQVEVDGKSRSIYSVPMPDGTVAELALVKPGRNESTFAVPSDVTKRITWKGSWRTLTPVWEISFTFGNYADVWRLIDFPQLLFNTIAIALVGTIGTVASCSIVAFAFARMRFPGRNAMFQLMIATIFIPGTVTLIPTYMLFLGMGWVGTWLPLIVPTFVANAFDVFLIRQYFLTIPREHDEAAQIDGANPWQTFWHVILPQSRAVIIAVSIFHFVYSWNDYFGPLIYLATKPELQTLGVGLARFSSRVTARVGYVEAATVMTLLIPVVLFIVFQRYFVRGVVVTTGIDK